MTYADPAQVAARLGKALTEPETEWVQSLLDDAEGLILDRIPDLAARIAAGSIAESAVVRIESWAAVRVVRNPEGKSSESIDDYRYTRGEATRSGELYISEADWAALTPNRGRRVASLRMIAHGDT